MARRDEAAVCAPRADDSSERALPAWQTLADGLPGLPIAALMLLLYSLLPIAIKARAIWLVRRLRPGRERPPDNPDEAAQGPGTELAERANPSS